MKYSVRQPRAATPGMTARSAFVSSFSPRLPAGASRRSAVVRLAQGPSPDGDKKKGGLWFILDPNTKGGIIFYGILGIALPFAAYGYLTGPMDVDIITAGNVIGVGYVGLGTVVWTGSYVFRVANKDMTYATQLKDYEAAVIQKRFDELSSNEVDALMGEIYPSKPASEPTIVPAKVKTMWKPDYGEQDVPTEKKVEPVEPEKEGITFEDFMTGTKGKR